MRPHVNGPLLKNASRDGIKVFQNFSVLMSHATDSVEINVVIMAACVPAMRPVFLIALRRPGALYYRSSARQHISYQVHPSSHDRMGNGSAGDFTLVSSTWKGADGDGEGLVQDESRILHTVEMDVRYEDNSGHEGSSGRPKQVETGW